MGRIRIALVLTAFVSCLPGQTTLRQAGGNRAIWMGAAADADEFGPSHLLEPDYAQTLATQYSMLEPENAMKWNVTEPAPDSFNFEPGDELVQFAQAHNMKVRGHNLCWDQANPQWLTTGNFTPAQLSQILQNHIAKQAAHYQGQVFAWDVVNEAVSDSATGIGTDLKNSIWYNQPGIGLAGTGYVEQAFRWAHAADPSALLFYNDYNIEDRGPKFDAVYNMLHDFVSRGVPIHGVGFQMHIDTSGYPASDGLAENIQRIASLGLQAHITEMDVRLAVDAAGNPVNAGDLQSQAMTYQRILTICLQNPACTAFQTWGFTDKYSWIPYFLPGYGAGLPFDASYQPKPAEKAMIQALQSVPPVLSLSGIVSAASYQGGAVAPGELVTIFGANYGPGSLVGLQLNGNFVTNNLAGTQIFFDGAAAPVIFSLVNQAAVVVPYGIAGKSQTQVQYSFAGVVSNIISVPVAAAAPGIFSLDASGRGPGAILNADNSLNSAAHPATAGSVVQIFATGGGTVQGGALDGALSTVGKQSLPVSATVGGVTATVTYAGPAPGLVSGVMQVNVVIPVGLASGPQPVVITVGGIASPSTVTVAVK